MLNDDHLGPEEVLESLDGPERSTSFPLDDGAFRQYRRLVTLLGESLVAPPMHYATPAELWAVVRSNRGSRPLERVSGGWIVLLGLAALSVWCAARLLLFAPQTIETFTTRPLLGVVAGAVLLAILTSPTLVILSSFHNKERMIR